MRWANCRTLLGWTAEGGCPYVSRNALLLPGLFLIPLLAIADRHARSQSHESHWREQQYQHAAADGSLAVFGCSLGGAVAHGATLAEGGRRPEHQKYREGGEAQLHFTPRCKIRNASGKKTSIMAKQNTSELMVTHFMGEISNFMCMK